MRTILNSANPKLSSGKPFWPERSHEAAVYPRLDRTIDCEVAVVGGGITGALVANRLTRAGLDVILVDKAHFGGGSTSASTALISYEFDLMLCDLIDRIGEAHAVRAYQLCYEATTRIQGLVHELEDPCDYEDKVSIRVTNDPADRVTLERELKVRNRHALKVELLDRGALHRRFEVTAKHGLVSQNAAQIDPLRLTRRLIATAARDGMRAFENTKITAFRSGKSGCELCTAANGRVSQTRRLRNWIRV